MVHKLLTLGVVNNAELRIIPRAPEGARPAAAAEWIAVTARAVYTSKGSIRHFEGTVTDITRCKTARMRAAQLQEQLEQARSLECAGVLARALAEDIGGLLEPIVQQTQSALNTLPATAPHTPKRAGSCTACLNSAANWNRLRCRYPLPQWSKNACAHCVEKIRMKKTAKPYP
jgi:hypothetical protein